MVDRVPSADRLSEALMNDIKLLLQSGDFTKAESQLLDLVASGPDHEEVLYMLAVSQRYLKKHRLALGTLDKLKRLIPDHSRAYQETGHVFRAMNNANAALNAYSRAVQINQSLQASFKAQIEILSATGRAAATGQLKQQLQTLQALPKPLIAVTDLLSQGKLVKAEQLCKAFMQ